MKQALLYPGCLILYRFPEYEYTSKLLLQELNISTRMLDEMVCCGAYIQGSHANWEYLAAYNMSLAEKEGLDIVTLCGGCTNIFKQVKHACDTNPEKLAELNGKLHERGLEFNNKVKVQHLWEVLHENYEELASLVSRPLSLNIAMMYPCQIFYPAEVMEFSHLQARQTIEKLAGLAKSNIVHYPQEFECCGSSLVNVKPDIAYNLGKNRLEALEKQEADVIITACGNCHVLLDRMQREYHPGRQIPAMFISQLWGWLLGWPKADLKIKSPLLQRVMQNV